MKTPRLSKPAIIKEAHQNQPGFSEFQETLTWSINIVLQERLLLMSNAFTDIPASGILDEDGFRDEKGIFRSDAWPTGKPPLTRQEILSYPTGPPRRIGPGDDGRELDFHY